MSKILLILLFIIGCNDDDWMNCPRIETINISDDSYLVKLRNNGNDVWPNKISSVSYFIKDEEFNNCEIKDDVKTCKKSDVYYEREIHISLGDIGVGEGLSAIDINETTFVIKANKDIYHSHRYGLFSNDFELIFYKVELDEILNFGTCL